MSLRIHLMILGVIFLVINCKFGESPSYSFKAYDYPSTGNSLDRIYLSTDEDKIAFFLWNTRSSKYYQYIFYLDGEKTCQHQLNNTIRFVGWPSKTSGIYYNQNNSSFWKANSPCTQPTRFIDLPSFYFKFWDSFIIGDQFIAVMLGDSNRVFEHSIDSGRLNRQFKLNNEKISRLQYSPNNDYLYAFTKTIYGNKVIVFNTKSGDRKVQIYTDLNLIKGDSNGEGFIAFDYRRYNKYTAKSDLFHVDKNGKSNKIWTSPTSNNIFEMRIGICTKDNRILAIRKQGISQNPKYYLISYDSNDGSVSQNFTLNFQPDNYHMSCNNNYLALMDVIGNVYIYKYNKRPLWATILAVVGLLLIIVGIAGFIIHKRKQCRRQVLRQEFINERNQMITLQIN